MQWCLKTSARKVSLEYSPELIFSLTTQKCIYIWIWICLTFTACTTQTFSYFRSLFHRKVKMLVLTKLISQLAYGQDERHWTRVLLHSLEPLAWSVFHNLRILLKAKREVKASKKQKKHLFLKKRNSRPRIRELVRILTWLPPLFMCLGQTTFCALLSRGLGGYSWGS